MSEKIQLNGIGSLSAYEGKELFTSKPLHVTATMIQDFCRSVNQMDWFHFDEERCKASPFGAVVAPGMYTMSLLHSVYFDHVELHNMKALFLGTDRFRILKPVKAGDSIVLKFNVDKIEQRKEGIAVHYDFTWTVAGDEQPVTLGNFIVRYWPL
ncbi:MaoC family dehydratase N-terminal domain-containing protein [Thalassotalea psychrophila]|uniref:MaoC family dehydratase N-terminal domain-containing protein n=1 Tax=Thalassotalea psychrophila TaxID=3065647 RepID=A0ABY9TXU9_9GAMM|nr:MaoC family dehydratase N-terminal domain-containing protein [Colwelliaceae bacterium SQ149]